MKDGRLIRRTTVGHRPASISADFTRGEIYVSNRGDASVSIVHAGTMKVIAKVPVGPEPGKLSVDSRRGLLYVVSAPRNVVDVVELATRRLIVIVAVGAGAGCSNRRRGFPARCS